MQHLLHGSPQMIHDYLVTHVPALFIQSCLFLIDFLKRIGGFDERLVSIEDLDFAKRLKALGQQRGQRFGTLWRQGIYTSCRKFDTHGDWHLVRNRRLVRRIFTGTDREAADGYYYDVDR